MEITSNTQRIMRYYLLEAREVVMGMLMSRGMGRDEAYAFAYDKLTLGKVAIKSQAASVYGKREGIRQLVEDMSKGDVKTSGKGGGTGKGDDLREARELRSKDDALDAVNRLIVDGNLTDKEKLAAIDLLNKLQQWNKEESKEDEKLVHFYLPLRCRDCSLYNDSLANSGKEG